jgi:hypothetical protein
MNGYGAAVGKERLFGSRQRARQGLIWEDFA